jgi:hypothetical protein
VEPRLELGFDLARIADPGVVISGTSALIGVPMVAGGAITGANKTVGQSLRLAGVAEPGVVIAGTDAFTGVQTVVGVAITGANITLGRSLWVVGVAEPGIDIAAAGALMDVLVTRDGNLKVCPAPRVLPCVGLSALSLILAVGVVGEGGAELRS